MNFKALIDLEYEKRPSADSISIKWMINWSKHG